MGKNGKMIRNLECELTDAEKLARGAELARAEREMRELKVAMQSKKQAWKKVEGELEAKISRFSIIVDSGKESRAVECREEYNWNDKTAECYRLDTGELVDTRPMYEHELQRELELNPPARS